MAWWRCLYGRNTTLNYFHNYFYILGKKKAKKLSYFVYLVPPTRSTLRARYWGQGLNNKVAKVQGRFFTQGETNIANLPRIHMVMYRGQGGTWKTSNFQTPQVILRRTNFAESLQSLEGEREWDIHFAKTKTTTPNTDGQRKKPTE